MAATASLAPETAASLAQRQQLLRTGCASVDHCLGGGIMSTGITEIAGEAGAGKTQMGLQLLLQVQLPFEHGGLQGGALLIHTEGGEPPMRRLRQIGDAFAAKWSQLGATCDRLCEHVFVDVVETDELLWNTLRFRVPSLLAQHRVRLIVIDSIGALFRAQLDESATERAAFLLKLAAELKRLSDAHGIAIVVINQVTDCMHAEGAAAKKAALGLAWSNCVNTRVAVRRAAAGVGPRELRVVLSPRVPEATCTYRIDAAGVRDADDSVSQGPGGDAIADISNPAGTDSLGGLIDSAVAAARAA